RGPGRPPSSARLLRRYPGRGGARRGRAPLSDLRAAPATRGPAPAHPSEAHGMDREPRGRRAERLALRRGRRAPRARGPRGRRRPAGLRMIAGPDVALVVEGHTIGEDVSFTIGRGESVALVGPNGSGKTSLLRCILGFVPFTGRLTVEGHDVVREPIVARALVGYVPQEAA